VKVATKFALAFIGCGLLSVLVYSAVAASREVERLEATVAEDLASIGRTLRTSVLSVWEKEGEARALELVARQDAASESETIDVRLTWLDVEANHSRFPRGGLSVIPSLLRNEQRTWVAQRPNGAREVYAYVPLIRPGSRPAAIEISRPLVHESDLFWQELRGQLVSSTIVAGFATFVAIVLTGWMVSAPLGRLTAQARRIGKGDFSQRVPVRGSDEVSTLASELNTMTDQLIEARARAQDETDKRVATLEQLRHADRLRTVGTLASGIAHELGTPLNVIAMRAKMLATGEVSADDAPASAKIIVAQTERVTKIVRQLLDFARRRPPNRADTDVGDLAERTAMLLEGLAKKARVEVKVQHDEEVRAKVDPMQIEQAITNLVINAVHAMPNGGTVVVTARNTKFRERKCALLEIADTGTGIAKEALDRIFEPFFTTKPVGEGTGLGLSVTHGIIQDHEGWMEVESEVGKGTTFKLYLPV
jgi:signal transduction histidine kinase